MSLSYWDENTAEISAKNGGLTAVRIVLPDVTLTAVTLTAFRQQNRLKLRRRIDPRSGQGKVWCGQMTSTYNPTDP